MGESSEILAGFSIALSATADVEAREFVRRQLRAFNDTCSEHHRAIRSVEPTPLDIVIRNEAGEILGGLIASTYWGWLEVNVLWIAEGLRRLGYGRTLLRMAETEARARELFARDADDVWLPGARVLREGRVSRRGRDGRLSARSGVLLDEKGFVDGAAWTSNGYHAF